MRQKNLFLRVNDDGLCTSCAEQKLQQELYDAKKYIEDLSFHTKQVFANSTILPHWGQKRIREIYDHCRYILDHIDEWKTYRYFSEAFDDTLVQKGHFKESSLFPFASISNYSQPNYYELFKKLQKEVSRIETDCIIKSSKAYDYSHLFTVVGVTFKNGRKSRQAILRKIRFGDWPFDTDVTFELEKYEFEGEAAVGVFANGEQVGNISRHDLPWLLEHWEDYYCVGEYDVHGGGDYSFGVDIRVCFREPMNK